MNQEKPHNLEDLLDRLRQVCDGDGKDASLRNVVEEIGEGTFGSMLLLAGLMTLAPLIGDVPGVPTVMAVLVLFTAAQLLMGRRHIWLPRLLLDRSVSSEKLLKAVDKLQKPARMVDRFLHARWRTLTGKVGTRGIAVCCLLVAGMMPFMEVVPFSANIAGVALTAFGLALVARDGILALAGFAVSVGAGVVVVWVIL